MKERSAVPLIERWSTQLHAGVEVSGSVVPPFPGGGSPMGFLSIHEPGEILRAEKLCSTDPAVFEEIAKNAAAVAARMRTEAAKLVEKATRP